MRKKYSSLSLRIVSVETEASVLVGSLTKTKVEIKSVSVTPYASGFEDADGNDFATISFD